MVSSTDIRCQEQTPSKVRLRCSVKTVVGQNAQLECDSLRNSQPVELTKHTTLLGAVSGQSTAGPVTLVPDILMAVGAYHVGHLGCTDLL